MEIKGQVLVYSIIGCPHCLRAKNKLNELSLPFSDVSLDSFPQVRSDLKRRTKGKTTVPQIFFNEHYIGGNDELQALVKNEKMLKKMIDMLKTTKPSAEAPQVPDPSTAVNYGENEEFECLPDEYAALVREMRNVGIVKRQKVTSGLFARSEDSFKGSDLVTYLVEKKGLDRKKAKQMGSELVSRNFGLKVGSGDESFSEDAFYKMLDTDHSSALNAGELSECAPIPAAELGELVRKQILKLYAKHLSKDGKSVDYAGLTKDAEFKEYMHLTQQLQRVDVKGASRSEKLSFFINIYNALVIHASVVKGKPSNLWQRYKFFNTVCYIIAGHLYSLQDIENGVLRGNRKGVGMFRKPFGSDDPRAKIALEKAEPLIHFALNCGAKSCPPIKTFSAKGIRGELKVAAEAFLETDEAVTINSEDRIISVSMIFKWYKVDFGGTDEKLLAWLAENMNKGEKRDELERLINGGNIYVKYLPYDWGSNEKDD